LPENSGVLFRRRDVVRFVRAGVMKSEHSLTDASARMRVSPYAPSLSKAIKSLDKSDTDVRTPPSG
jgi:hypothetical protein